MPKFGLRWGSTKALKQGRFSERTKEGSQLEKEAGIITMLFPNDIKEFRFYLQVVKTIQSHGGVTELPLILKLLLTNDSLFVLYSLFSQTSKECQYFEH